ncbi:hypothetical protein [Solimonas soli]|uniref:hypothetical protein n=1 Tax=Solimonas soli TaxID=413479 RepID=UPI0012F727F1|nr:hypothetical protein [Solimonas soli]
MIPAGSLFGSLPAGLRDPLLEEYRSILQNFLERRWNPAELSGGRFCEIVYSILHGHASNAYPPSPFKPPNFLAACRALESNGHVPRSFQILIPRLLPGLYEIRNNRGVGHVGGDVDSNPMDAAAVVNLATWILSELIRVFHNVPIGAAQATVNALAELRIPLVWDDGNVKRILHVGLPLKDQVLILAATSAVGVQVSDLLSWTEYENRGYFLRLLRKMHKERLIELSSDEKSVRVLPPGAKALAKIITEREGV